MLLLKMRFVVSSIAGKPVTLAERVELFIEEHNLDIKLDYGAFPDRPYDSPVIYGDASKIQQIMNHSK